MATIESMCARFGRVGSAHGLGESLRSSKVFSWLNAESSPRFSKESINRSRHPQSGNIIRLADAIDSIGLQKLW